LGEEQKMKNEQNEVKTSVLVAPRVGAVYGQYSFSCTKSRCSVWTAVFKTSVSVPPRIGAVYGQQLLKQRVSVVRKVGAVYGQQWLKHQSRLYQESVQCTENCS
jgi:hypothetical protein